MVSSSKKKLPKKVTDKVKKFIKIIEADKTPVNEVYVFGSYAKGKQHKWSDIDVCVISPKFKNSYDALLYLWRKRPDDLYLTIEPVGYSPKNFASDPSPFVYEIKKHGIQIEV